MRPDMFKIIVERPRRSHNADGIRLRTRLGNRTTPVPEDDEAAVHPLLGPFQTKSLSENLRPLERYLRSSVGRPWDKVYSEIRQRIDARSAVKLHILQHLAHFVEINCHIGPDGVPMAFGRFGLQPIHYGFYVHPKTGILREAKRPRPQAKPLRYDAVSFDGRRAYQIGGIWYELLHDPPGKRQLDRKTIRRIRQQIERAKKGKAQLPGWAFGFLEESISRRTALCFSPLRSTYRPCASPA
jgi:hypothetical protein